MRWTQWLTNWESRITARAEVQPDTVAGVHPARGGRSTRAPAVACGSTTGEGLDLQVILAALRRVMHAAHTALQIGRRDHDSMSRPLDQASAEFPWLWADSCRWNRRRATASSCADRGQDPNREVGLDQRRG